MMAHEVERFWQRGLLSDDEALELCVQGLRKARENLYAMRTALVGIDVLSHQHSWQPVADTIIHARSQGGKPNAAS